MSQFKALIQRHQRLTIALIFLILAGLFIIPFTLSFTPMIAGDDSKFHLSRTYSLYLVLKSGHLLPGYDFMAFNNVGTMVNVFYPYLTTSLPIALLQFLTHHWLLSYKLFFFCTTWLTLYVSYYTVQKLTNRHETATIFAILYTFCTYRIDVTYPRFDLGEYAVFIVLPLIFIGFELMLQKQDYSKWPWVALGMTFVMYSHLLSVLLIALILGLRLLIGLGKVHKLFFINLAKAIGVFSFLSLYQLISILEQFQFQALKTVSTDKLTKILKDPADLLVNSLNNSIYVYTIGFFGVFALFLILTHLTKLTFNDIHYGAFVFLGLLTFILTSKLFPWKHFNGTIVNMMQYPYRFTMFASFFFLLVGSVIITQLLDATAAPRIWPLLAGFVIFLIVFGRSIDDITHKANKVAAAQYPEITYFQMADFENATTNDYIPVKALDHWSELQVHTFYIDNRQPADFSLSADEDHFVLTFKTTKAKQIVTMPILNYKGTVVLNPTDNTRFPVKSSKYGTIQVTMPHAGGHKLVISYQPSLLRKLSAFISAASALLFSILAFRRRWEKF
ncbi:hypothetical protein ACFQ5M_07520 [Agrilactobacillus yilanensis]|uniref:YfhO family protein n=1 Tax=Agrilactobacillus yilanensis TaxID=2485997 RepID=A0ABW4J7N4_9LACO|nr:hypothetical protein [Agrilactobacillus yilanensis]